MEHSYSILFAPVNRLLLAVFGAAPEKYQALMGTHDGYWLPDHVVMSMLIVVVVALALIPLRNKFSVEAPGKFQQILELTLSGLKDLIEEVVRLHGYEDIHTTERVEIAIAPPQP